VELLGCASYRIKEIVGVLCVFRYAASLVTARRNLETASNEKILYQRTVLKT
jgi:hypothetical protein